MANKMMMMMLMIVLDGDPAPLSKKGRTPNLRPMSVVPKWLHGLRCHLIIMDVGLYPGDFVLDGDPAPIPKTGQQPPIFSP